MACLVSELFHPQVVVITSQVFAISVSHFVKLCVQKIASVFRNIALRCVRLVRRLRYPGSHLLTYAARC